ncbi:hypothetical protein BHE74_00044218 [Ensete ventricosum]|uniref:Uncharacterized protein n=1 Tax=Ensete ventricosum TaxID=4639 RepID=A0A444E077_ENSVE|nr:hypothetical protein B296_00018846 [Ensete ventricosum]RWW03769.1 hypothetical protein GW17_00033043 [Ensete ventricosum]RWW49592.1 hypothetical protein BHE74_00044218 [Ensete ventricosum]
MAALAFSSATATKVAKPSPSASLSPPTRNPPTTFWFRNLTLPSDQPRPPVHLTITAEAVVRRGTVCHGLRSGFQLLYFGLVMKSLFGLKTRI